MKKSETTRQLIIEEARPGIVLEGKVEVFLVMLTRYAPSLQTKFETRLKSLTTPSEFQELESEIWSDISKLRHLA